MHRVKQAYKNNGKELDRHSSLDWYDYGARWYNGLSWMTPDPLAEKYYDTSPYVYCANNPINAIDPDGKDILLVIWASHNGRIGHAGIAISNYKEKEIKVKINGQWTTQKKMVKDDTYTYRDLWPGGNGVGKNNFDQDVPAVYKNEIVTLHDILYSDITKYEGLSADGVVRITSNYNVDQRIQKKLDSYESENPNYNALTNNCSDYAATALEEAVRRQLPVDEKLSSKVSATTPNQVFKASRIIKGNEVLKNPGDKVNESFIHTVSGGGLKQKIAEKKLDY